MAEILSMSPFSNTNRGEYDIKIFGMKRTLSDTGNFIVGMYLYLIVAIRLC